MNNKQSTIKIIQRLIVVVFIVSIFQFAIPKEAFAIVGDTSVLKDYWANPNQINPEDPYRVTVSKVLNSGIIQQVVGCTGVVNKVSTWMSKFIQSPTQQAKLTANKIAKVRAQLENACAASKSTSEAAGDSIPIIGGLSKSIGTIYAKIRVGGVEACKDKVQSMDPELLKKAIEEDERDIEIQTKEQCLDGIAIMLAKNQLTSMTRSAVNWVNSGYGGNPFFVQNMTNLTNGLERNVLETGTDILLDEAFGSPYARDFARSTVTSYRSGRGIGSSSTGLLGNLQSDLGFFVTDPKSYYSDDQLGQADDTRSAYQRAQDVNNAFSNDFSTGGWNGWLALTQRDQNNPLGFTMLASQQLADEQEQRKTAIQNELNQNNGFLSQKTCVKWQVYNEDGKPKTEMNPNYGDGNDTINPRQYVFTTTKPRTCYKAGGDCCASEEDGGWKTITPGSIIKDKTTSYLNSPERQLELADTINESLNALFSVLISKLQGGGLSGLSDNAINNTNWTDNLNDDWTTSSDPYSNNGAYGNFNLTRDLGNTYIHDTTYKVGTWNAKTNTTTIINNKDRVDDNHLYPDLAPEFHDGNGNIVTSNTYFEVSVAGNTKLINEGYNGWSVGDRAFWNGSEWQNWKKGQTSPMKKRGVIQIQQDYIVAAKEILKVLPNIMPKLGELDYCIPGPNPSYKTNSSDAQSAYQDWVGSIYVGIMDATGERYGVKIDNVGDSSYSRLQDIYADNSNVWKKIKDSNHFNYLINQFTNICNDGTGLFGWGGEDCSGNYFYAKNSDLSEDDGNHLAGKTKIMNLNQNYVNNSLFQNFYEVFDKMMEKLYFKNITSVYNEREDIFDNDKNSGYIPMAESGLDLTKDIYYYNEDYAKAIEEYTSAVNQAKVNIAKLEPIKAEVSTIIKAAQERRNKKLLETLQKETEKQCKSESQSCLKGVDVPPGVSTDDLGEYCLGKYNACIKNTMTEAQYKTKYAGCLDEEDIQVFDVDDITNLNNYDPERCFNSLDDDLDGLIDSKDPDCKDNNTGGTNKKKCVIVNEGINSDNFENNKKCSERQNESDCVNTSYYNGPIAYMCGWTEGAGLSTPTVSIHGCTLDNTQPPKPNQGNPNRHCLDRKENECTLTKYINQDNIGYTCKFLPI